MTRIRVAMLLAAGRGERLRPITDSVPKPLVRVGGRTMLDRALDALEAFGIERAVVNTSHLARLVEACLAARAAPPTVAVREPERLETGGGVRNARAHLGGEPFLVMNADVVVPEAERAFAALAGAWDGEAMDALLLVVPRGRATGYAGAGDFRFEAGPPGPLGRGPAAEQPYVFTGLQILSPRLLDGAPEGAFPLPVLYERARREGRLHGVVHDGAWLHIGDEEALAEAEALLGGGD